MLGTSSRSTAATRRTSQTDSTRCIVSSATSGIAITPIPLSGLENLPTPIHNPEPHAIITNPLWTLGTEKLEREAVAIANAGIVNTSINGLQQSQHPSIRSLRHDTSCVCNGQTPGPLYLEQIAVYKCKQLGDGMLCIAKRFESITWSPILPDQRDLLEHRYPGK